MLYVFDIPVASGADLRDRPLIERKRILQKTLAGLADSNVRCSSTSMDSIDCCGRNYARRP